MRAALLIALVAVSLASASKKKCGRQGEELYRISRLATITDRTLSRVSDIVRRLPERCSSEDIIVKVKGQDTNLGTVTHVLGRICAKSDSPKAVTLYMQYRMANSESADEEFSLSLERLLVSKPAMVLGYVRRQPDSVRTLLLNDIVWGFLSNRVYGPVNPYENKRGRRFTNVGDIPKEVLNRKTYKKIFFRLNEDMGEVTKEYEPEVTYVLEEIRKYLETWGVEY